MNQAFTAEQKEQLKTWVEQRDDLLLEISNLKEESFSLRKTNEDLAKSSSDMDDRMKEVKGRIEELKIKEAELLPLISKELAGLQAKKSTLEAEIPLLKKIIEELTVQKRELGADIVSALSTFDTVKDEALLLDQVVDRVTRVSEHNTSKIDSLVKNLATSLEDIVKVNKENVEQTNIVIDKVPKMLVEIQKKGLVRHRL